MELLSNDLYYILVNDGESLWINRKNSALTNKSTGTWDATNFKCLGLVYGYIGKLDFSDKSEARLVFIRQRELVGVLHGKEIFRIVSVISLPLETDIDCQLLPCPKHPEKPDLLSNPIPNVLSEVGTTQGVSSRNPTKSKSPSAPNHPSAHLKRQPDRIDKVDKKLLDEFHKMFTEANSFYYSTGYDLTNTVQRTFFANQIKEVSSSADWHRADNRFIWNISMVDDLMRSKDAGLDRWIIPIVQGFIQYETCVVENLFDNIGPDLLTTNSHLELWLISRRSRFRAGTRYRRRGIDENGKTANYVETEQIVIFSTHTVSFVQTRGSIPIFWSQPGFRYRPPPRIDKPPEESLVAFKKHLAEEEQYYGRMYLVSLVDKTGKEKILGDAYMDMVLKYDLQGLTYLTYDFHENCRGMHFENVSSLISQIMECAKEMNYCWVDSYGLVLQQGGVCRTNCVDCLDRTNVVQTHLGRQMLCIQLGKLGLLAPEIGLPANLKQQFQCMWANNGDTISRQYAGTNALKGDYTRSGERRIAGVLKDGMNSANRYYLNRFKDAYRQAAIDAMLGLRRNFTEAYLESAAAGRAEDEHENTIEQIKSVIEDAKKCIVPKPDVILGSWGLVNAKNNDPDTIDIDAILILTDHHYYFAEYDCNLDVITETQKVDLSAITALDLGFEPLLQPSSFWTIFHQGNSTHLIGSVPCLRISYKSSGVQNIHQFRSSNIRFFNNVTVPIEQPEEMLDCLRVIALTIQSAALQIGTKVKLDQLPVLPVKQPQKSAMSGMGFVNKYFSSAQSEAVERELPRKNATSFERFTPKYFRRSSATALPAHERARIVNADDMQAGKSNSSLDKKEDPKKIKNLVLPFAIGSESNSRNHYSQFPDSTLGASTPSNFQHPECSDLSHFKSNDLVLSSCGLVAVPASTLRNYQAVSLSLAISPILLHPSELALPTGSDDQDNLGLSLSPSPCYDIGESCPIVSRSSDIDNDKTALRNLATHRNSLPSQSLGTGLGLTVFPQRSLTPEITITEEETSDVSTGRPLAVSSTLSLKRMSKSSEDITNDARAKNSSALVEKRKMTSGPHLTLNTGLDSARSTSVQDLSGSVLNMKSSHSANTLGDTRFPTGSQQSGGVSKKALVFAPLGKLARGMQNLGTQYFDPRKLRDTFKPQNVRKEAEILSKEEREEEIRILEERKANCKSLIVEL